MNSSRRDFIKSLGLFMLAPHIASCIHHPLKIKNSSQKLLINSAPGGGYGNAEQIVQTPPGTVQIFDTITQKIRSLELSYFGHLLIQNPNMNSEFYTFEQYGKKGVLINAESLQIKTYLEAEDMNTFMGHAACVPSKDIILTIEQNHIIRTGEIGIRDSKTLKLIQKYSSYGLRPHDCHLLLQQQELAVVNDYGPSNISFVDIQSGQLKRQIYLDEEQKLRFNHFEISSDHWICAGARKPSGHVVLINPEGKLLKLPHPVENKTGVLSITFLKNTDFVVATYPEGGTVALWNYKTQELVASAKLAIPKGVIDLGTHDPSFLVSLERERGIRRLSLTTSQELKVENLDSHFGGTGAHLSNANW